MSAALVPSDLSTIGPVDARHDTLSKVRVREYLERQICALMDAGGAWHTDPNRKVLAGVARALVLALDENGVAWPSESYLQRITGYGVSAVQRALRVIAGDGAAPGALFARRFLRPDEVYTRRDGNHSTPGYLYYAHRPPVEARAADTPSLSVAKRNPKAARGRQRSLYPVGASSADSPAARSRVVLEKYRRHPLRQVATS